MNDINRHRKAIKNALVETLKIEGSHLVVNRHRTIRHALISKYPNLINSVSKDVMTNFIKDVTYADRMLRKLTEGEEVEEKTILSQDFQINELGMEVGSVELAKDIRNITQ